MERTSGARTGGRVLSLLRRTVLNSNCNVQLVFDAMPSLIGTILLENLRLVVAGAAALSYERNGKMEAVLMKENALLPPMGGWGVRVYSVWMWSDTSGKH